MSGICVEYVCFFTGFERAKKRADSFLYHNCAAHTFLSTLLLNFVFLNETVGIVEFWGRVRVLVCVIHCILDQCWNSH